MKAPSALTSGTFLLGGDLEVTRLGFGAMRLVGEGVWGDPPPDIDSTAVLRRATEWGVNFIDTADSYGPATSEEQIRVALHPYPGLVIATKCGFTRPAPGVWRACGFPPYLQQQVELSRRRLGVECLDLLQLHRIDEAYPLADQVGALAELQAAGKIRHIGLSEVSVSQLEEARKVAPIVSVQNLYNPGNRQSEEVLAYCDEHNIGFIPWYPLGSASLLQGAGPIAQVSKERGVGPAEVVLAWLLAKSPVMLPIPGTSKIAHLEQNLRAAEVVLSEQDRALIDTLDAPPK
jgi:pyridoxine 4-dehydrogenase